MTGLKLNIPWEQLVSMQFPRLVMMLGAAYPPSRKSGAAGSEVREATQADIDALLT